MSRLQYRSTLTSIVSLLHNVKFTEAQKQEIQKSPFATMLLAITENNLDKQTVKKHDNNILSLIQRYKKNEGRFMLGEKSVRITHDEIGLIFGITSGTTRILLGPQTKKPNTEFVNRNFDRKTKMNYVGMRERITTLIDMPSKGKEKKGLEQEVEKDLARMLTLYVLGTVFFKTTGPNFNWSYIELVENLEECNTYAWSKYITDFLITELDKKCGNPATVGGCTVALLYWLCEHTKIMEPREPHVPRFMKWKVNELDAKLFETPVDKILPDMVIDSELKPTDEEKALFTILPEQPVQALEFVLGMDALGNIGIQRAIIENGIEYTDGPEYMRSASFDKFSVEVPSEDQINWNITADVPSRYLEFDRDKDDDTVKVFRAYRARFKALALIPVNNDEHGDQQNNKRAHYNKSDDSDDSGKSRTEAPFIDIEVESSLKDGNSERIETPVRSSGTDVLENEFAAEWDQVDYDSPDDHGFEVSFNQHSENKETSEVFESEAFVQEYSKASEVSALENPREITFSLQDLAKKIKTDAGEMTDQLARDFVIGLVKNVAHLCATSSFKDLLEQRPKILKSLDMIYRTITESESGKEEVELFSNEVSQLLTLSQNVRRDEAFVETIDMTSLKAITGSHNEVMNAQNSLESKLTDALKKSEELQAKMAHLLEEEAKIRAIKIQLEIDKAQIDEEVKQLNSSIDENKKLEGNIQKSLVEAGYDKFRAFEDLQAEIQNARVSFSSFFSQE